MQAFGDRTAEHVHQDVPSPAYERPAAAGPSEAVSGICPTQYAASRLRRRRNWRNHVMHKHLRMSATNLRQANSRFKTALLSAVSKV